MGLVSLLTLASAGSLSITNKNEMDLTLLEGTLCLDGTKAGYYYSAPQSGSSSRWMFFMEGGGACESLADCKQRAKGSLGSSKTWAATHHPGRATGGTFFSQNSSINPEFYDAHHVYIPYGTGDGHKGTSPAGDNAWGLNFMGHSNFIAIIKDLEAKYKLLSNSTAVLLQGSSAGGMGTFANADTLGSMFTASPAPRFKAAPIAGFFFPTAIPSDAPPGLPQSPPSNYSCFAAGEHCGIGTAGAGLYDLEKPNVPAACVADQKANQQPIYYCNSIGVWYPYIKTPLFVIEAQYDINQLYGEQGVPKGNANSTTVNYIRMYGEAMRNSTTKVLKDGDGIFSPSCLAHPIAEDLTINGHGWVDIVTDWFFDYGKLTQYYRLVEECPSSAGGLPCNPSKVTCKLSGTPTPPGPPTPPAPAGACEKQLRADGCLTGDEVDVNKCDTCSQAHAADLEKAGCTRSEVIKLCKGE